MEGKVCLITGANRGIGRATAEGLARLGATVIITSRRRDAGEAAVREIIAATGNQKVSLLVADFSTQAAVRQLVEDVKAATPQLDVLINNAGSYHAMRTKTPDGIEATFAVNHLAPFLLTTGLLPLLEASAPARVIVVASEAHQRVTDPEDWESAKAYNGLTAYSRSKLANVMFGYDLAHRLEGHGVTVNSCHPGLVKSALLESGFDRWWLRWAWPIATRFMITPEEGATTLLYLAASPEVEGVTGKYFKRSRAATSSLLSHDAVVGARLWNVSLRLTGQLPAAEITGEHIAH
ncbi:MAG TPA: SDR family oxidoreductase [Gemmatimonadales bacterium]|jgi:retinol dehydrogenase-14|nr:SDR family oxidoreductase [Gemmatimonadales bacterium]